MKPANRIALVTGAARRMGREIALGLARAGWDVAVHYGSSASQAQETVGDIQALGRRAQAFEADLADETATLALLDRVEQLLGPVGCLVNNASRFEFDTPADFGSASLAAHVGPNLAAPLLLTRRLHELRLAARAHHDAEHGAGTSAGSGADAVVINLLDQKVDNLNPDFFSYTLTKSALLAATRMTASAFAPVLRVNAVSPGATLTSWRQTADDFEQASRIALLGRSSTPADIVQAVVYLAVAEAVTGVNLTVDGGQHLMPLGRDVMFLGKSTP